MNNKIRAPRNRTVTLSNSELEVFADNLLHLDKRVKSSAIINKTINQDLFSFLEFLPRKFIDLLIVDPPYNMDKTFNSNSFKEKSIQDYAEWIDSFLKPLIPCLKPTASIYFCGDWRSSTSLHLVLSKYFKVRNRITWEREKGRGSKVNWKNNSEDIWYCTLSDDFIFNVNDVKVKRKVMAPYKEKNGMPKDWNYSGDDAFRLTFPSNIWTDISIPFWSMAENTDHPTQKPEKLIAKLILASSNPNMVVFDPFLGSGTTSVVAKKLGRKYIGVEIDKHFACLAEKRLQSAEQNLEIQGFYDGVFWERNTLMHRKLLKNNEKRNKP
ncbi:MAG: site-specific DNA-methyltransferase [Bacteroidetes bacterium]|nr:site-specific DNA-methyltransferase [Bacteroidota bacterium]